MMRAMMGKKKVETIAIDLSEYMQSYIRIDVPDLSKVPKGKLVNITWNPEGLTLQRVAPSGYTLQVWSENYGKLLHEAYQARNSYRDETFQLAFDSSPIFEIIEEFVN